MATETKTFYPGAYDASDYKYNFVEDMDAVVGKGSGNVSSYATIALTIGSTAITYVFFPFDLSAIPQDATIDSVSCKARGATNSSSYSKYRHANFQLYSGSVAKGTLTTYLNTDSAVYTLDVGTWTRAELNDCRLRVGAVRGSTNVSTAYAIYFYGADLTVTYTYQSEKFMLKLDGAWHDIARVFKKVSGIWVEQTDLANVIEDGVRYKNGGEIESTAPKPISVTITGTGHGSRCFATINGTTYAGAASNIEVYPGDSITFGVYSSSQSSSPAGGVSIDGTNVVSVNGGFKSYQWVVPNGVDTISVAFAYYNGLNVYGTITVTTTGSGSSTNLITFTINGVSYQAETGMTWDEWVDSDYNTGAFFVWDENMVYDSEFAPIITSSGSYVYGTTEIVVGGAYKSKGA